jgi:hypothetical protein
MIRILGYTNSGQIPLAANWISSLARLELLERVTLYCTSRTAVYQLQALCNMQGWAVRLELFDVSHYMGGAIDIANATNWSTPEFARLVVGRLHLLFGLCQQIAFEPFLMADLDCAFVQDPEPFLQSCGGSAPWIQSNRDDFERPSLEHKEFCNGIVYYPTPQPEVFRRAIDWLVQRWPSITTAAYVDDEDARNAVMHELGIEPGVLPIDKFPTGRLPWDRDPIIVHANWVIGMDAKIDKLRAGGHWYLKDRA